MSYGLSPVWTLMCLCRCGDWLNAFSHRWHLYGFSPLWILLCLTSSPDVVNRLLQTVHSNGFSPEWLRLCTARSLLPRKHLPHSVHLYLPAWIFICLYRPFWDAKRFSHWVHKYSFSPVCLLLWLVNCDFVVNCLRHTVHKYDRVLSSCGCPLISLLSASVSSCKPFAAKTQHTLISQRYHNKLAPSVPHSQRNVYMWVNCNEPQCKQTNMLSLKWQRTTVADSITYRSHRMHVSISHNHG